MESSIVRLGMSPGIREIEEDIALTAETEARVLITGESGVGKEFIARLIHGRGRRAGSPLVPVRCAGAAVGLEGQLFGGSSGGADGQPTPGHLEIAHEGTVFLDEVGETSPQLQERLLRFIESGEIARDAPAGRCRVDVRLIASASRPLTEQATFRDDLYYRLNVVHIAVPPLRERREDIVVLMNDFLLFFARTAGVSSPELTADAWERLTDYAWPGNVRELRHVAKRLIRHHGGGRVRAHDLPGEIWLQPAEPTPRDDAVPGARPVPRCLLEQLMGDRVAFRCDGRAFDARELSRDALRQLMRLGFEHARTH